jgi:hypothetical protein
MICFFGLLTISLKRLQEISSRGTLNVVGLYWEAEKRKNMRKHHKDNSKTGRL